jgi:hypothetical protein
MYKYVHACSESYILRNVGSMYAVYSVHTIALSEHVIYLVQTSVHVYAIWVGFQMGDNYLTTVTRSTVTPGSLWEPEIGVNLLLAPSQCAVQCMDLIQGI